MSPKVQFAIFNSIIAIGVLAALLSSAHAADDREQTKMTPDELVKALKNPNKPPVIDKERRNRAEFPVNYDWQAQTRVLNAWKALHDRCEESLAALVAHIEDDDYCVTAESGQSGASKNYSVGDVCVYILRLNVEPYRRPFFRSHYGLGLVLSYDRQDRPTYQRAIPAWWKTRQNQSLAELQTESIDWTIKDVNKNGSRDPSPLSEKERGEIVDDLRKMLLEVQSTKSPIRPDWRDSDELRFTNYRR